MKILYIAPKYDYGRRDRGFSFEHCNFYDSLFNMGNDIVYFDYMDIMQKLGRSRMNSLLMDVFHRVEPELVFVILSEYELDMKVISRMSKSGQAVTVNWFADDHWRFENFSRYWAPCFNWIITTDSDAVSKYFSIGYKNVILSQWACNHFHYKKLNKEPIYDVSFVGQAYGDRRDIIAAIEESGISVITRGQGWDDGRVSQEEMIDIFNCSKINLNLANASVKSVFDWVGPIDRIGLYTPGLRRIWRKVRLSQPFARKAQTISQIKGRNFEVPGCGGFLLTDYVSSLNKYYAPNKDIVCYRSLDELIEKIHYYLVNDQLREKIAVSGWQKTLENHTYVHRFVDIFNIVGLECVFSLESQAGCYTEISEEIS
jgi:spore maturation protein CgeB